MESGLFGLTFLDYLIILAGFIVSFGVTRLLMPSFIQLMHQKGITGVDVHKLEKPEVAERGGIPLLVGICLGCLVVALLIPTYFIEVLVFLLGVIIAGLVGYIDDVKVMRAWQKPVLIMSAGIPLFLYHFFVDQFRLFLPFIGYTRLTIVYPLMIPIVFAVCANTVNMMDVFNGSMSGSFCLISLTIIIATIVIGALTGAVFASILLGALLALYWFNRYPAKVFSGNIGSLIVGAGLASVTIMGHIEIVAVVAVMPFIMNAFHSLASMGGLFERHDVRARPIKVLSDGRLAVTTSKDAPLTLTRLLLVKGPLTEKQVVWDFFLLSIFSSGFALITLCLMILTGGLV